MQDSAHHEGERANRPAALLKRLDEIGAALAATEGALALLGLGSVGIERERLDAFSDLDFFVIATPETRDRLLSDLGWLAAIHPIAFAFQNERDGYKLLFEDGILCEFALFSPEQMQGIPFTGGQIVWQHPHFDPSSLVAVRREPPTRTVEWLVGEALTNVYVGLQRFRRGEKLTAMRFIQSYALDRVLELTALVESPQPGFVDPFGADRRFEQRFPGMAAALPRMAQGYAESPASAHEILSFLEKHFPVNAALKGEIEALIAG